MPPLNLATRPFRNERLAALLLTLGFTVALAVTVKHAFAIRALMPGRTSGLAREVQQLEDELSRLRAETASMRAPRPDPGAVAHWALLKELVDQRTFAWSGLFAVLERSLPRGVRLVSIAPDVEKGEIVVDIMAIARSNEDVLELITALEAQPEFEEVLPRARSGEGELNFRVSLKYRPAAAPAAVAAAEAASPSPAPEASPGAAVSASPLAVATSASPSGTPSASPSGAPSASPSGPTAAAPRNRASRKTPESFE